MNGPGLGDFVLGSTFDFKFTSRQFSSGSPFTLAGTPALAAYPDNSTTEITAGITLTPDFDGRTGLNQVRIVASSANGYAAQTNYDVVVTAGTVDGVSVVGEVIERFSIENRHTGLDFSRVLPASGSILLLGVQDRGIAQAVDATTLTLAATAPDDSVAAGAYIWALGSTQGFPQQTYIRSITGKVVTHNGWPIATPSGTVSYVVVGVPQTDLTLLPQVDVRKTNNVDIIGDGSSGDKFRGNP